MKALGLYAAVGMAIVLGTIFAAWTFLSEAGRDSMVTAAVIAWPLQVGFFSLLARAQGEPARFMVWWGAGVLGRMFVIAGVGLAMGSLGIVEPGVLLMSLAGFLFTLLLLEPFFLDHGKQTA